MNCFKITIKMTHEGNVENLYLTKDIVFSEYEAKISECKTRLEWDTLPTIIERYGIADFQLDKSLFGNHFILRIDTFYSKHTFSERKYRDLRDANIELTITRTPYNPSIKEVIENTDGLSAIQYLVERGLNVTNS